MINYQNTPIIQSYTYTYPKSVFTTLGTIPIDLIPPQSNKLPIFWGLSFVNNCGVLPFTINLLISTSWYNGNSNLISDYSLTFDVDKTFYFVYPKLNNPADAGLYRTFDPLADQTIKLYGAFNNVSYILQDDFTYTIYYSEISY